MSLTQEKRLDNNFTNNNDHSYLHKKFKKASTTAVLSPIPVTPGDGRQKEVNAAKTNYDSLYPSDNIVAIHPEQQKIKLNQDSKNPSEKHVQINFNDNNSRISNKNIVQVTGQTSFTEEFYNKTENLEIEYIRENHNGGTGGRYLCPYCKLSCAKPSVLQKHIRAHTNERPYPCIPCGFAFKTKSNLYKHQRSRTHALRSQGADINTPGNEEFLSGGSESDSSLPPASMFDSGSDGSVMRAELRANDFSPESIDDRITPPSIQLFNDNIKSKTIYKPKFRAAFYQEIEENDKIKKINPTNADILTEHISKIISDNEAIIDVLETPLQKKYAKIRQIAESKKFYENNETKADSSPLNLTKNSNDSESNFRKRSHSESFSLSDYQKHPLNPEGSIIKDLLLKNKLNGIGASSNESIEGTLNMCPLCSAVYQSVENLEIHRMYYCKGSAAANNNMLENTSPKDTHSANKRDNIFVRSNSINVRLPENTQIINTTLKSPPLRTKPDNIVIIKPETNDVVAPLPSPGPLLGNTRLVDVRGPSDYARMCENTKLKNSSHSPKRKLERPDVYSPRLSDNISPKSADLYQSSKIRCLDMNSGTLRSMEDITQHMKQNSTSLQMFGGEVKIVDHSGGTTTLRIEPRKNQLSPILIQPTLSPSKLANDAEASSVVVRSGLHSGGTMVHNPPTPKEIISTPQTPRISSITNVPVITNSNMTVPDVTRFQFPPLGAIKVYNPLTLPPLSPSKSPNGPTTILHGGKLIPHVPGMPGPNTPGMFISNRTHRNSVEQVSENINSNVLPGTINSPKTPIPAKYDMSTSKRPVIKPHIEPEHLRPPYQYKKLEITHVTNVPIIKVNNVETNVIPKQLSPIIGKTFLRQDGVMKRDSDGHPRNLNKNNGIISPRHKLTDKFNNIHTNKHVDSKCENEIRNFNFENLITKAEIYNNQISNSLDVHKNTSVEDGPQSSYQTERSETSYFQKNNATKTNVDDRKPKFLRPTTLPLKPGTYTPKRHHGITPNANTMPLVSPETPRPAKAYGQLYLNGNAYTYLGLKCSTKVFYCTINRPQPTYVPNQHFLSMYSNWQLLSELTPDPLGLSASSAMSLYDSRHRPQTVAVALIKQDLILTHSSQWNKNMKENKQIMFTIDGKRQEESQMALVENAMMPKKELTGGFESNEEYTYVRGRGRGRYVCSECGIRCKKPSMLKKHIRTHTDVRPYTCKHCAFSFKTKGNLTKHMKSKAHYKKCCELGINPNEGGDPDAAENSQGLGESDEDTESDGDEGNEGETESSDTEISKSRLPEHEAAHCLLSLRQVSTTTPGLITSARPSTYPYTPKKVDSALDHPKENEPISDTVDQMSENDSEPMDLSKSEIKCSPNITDIPTARESSVLASLASNTAKLPQPQTQWTNGEHLLHTYLTERALLDSKIKQSQLDPNSGKLRKLESEKAMFSDNVSTITTAIANSSTKVVNVKQNVCIVSSQYNSVQGPDNKIVMHVKSVPVTKEENRNVEETLESIPASSKRPCTPNTSNTDKVVADYIKHANINFIKSNEDSVQNQIEEGSETSHTINTEEKSKIDDINVSDNESVKLPSMDHDPVARKVVIGAGGVAFKFSKGKEFDGTSPYSLGRLMEDGRRVCDFCNKTFTKPSLLRLHLNIHYIERPFRCSACAVSFRTRGHLQKHERSGSHHNKVSMTSTFGAATSLNPRPFRCSDCNIAFRIHGHLAKHLRSKMHVMRLECLFKLPFGTFTEIERAGVSLTDIDTTDCASSLASLQSLARKLHEKDPSKLDYRESNAQMLIAAGRESSDEEDEVAIEKSCESDKVGEIKPIDHNECQSLETQINYSATDN